MSYGSIASGIGQGASAINNYFAMGSAAESQRNALNQIYDNITKQMDPAVLDQLTAATNEKNAKDRLALQAKIDPQLAAQRTVSEQKISDSLNQLGNAPSDQVAQAATRQALAGVAGLDTGTANLVAAGNQNLALGSSLPADVQAQLMQAGLEQSGQMTGRAGARGAGGTILQQILGTAGIQLQQQRQQQAANLMNAASNLNAQRQQILSNLFPRLQQQQMGNLSAASGILQQSNSMMPQAGLTGTEAANLWLARLGAMNSNIAQKGQVDANTTMGQAGAMSQLASSFGTALGGSGGGAGGANDTVGFSQFFNSGGKDASTPTGQKAVQSGWGV